jgi:hypothetical protein
VARDPPGSGFCRPACPGGSGWPGLLRLLPLGPPNRHLPAFLACEKQACQGPDGIILKLKEFNEIPFHSHIVLFTFMGRIGFLVSLAW